jgi:hypothetical protein
MYKKVKQSHNTPTEAQGEERYSSNSFTPSALEGGEWSASRPGRALPSRKGLPVPIGQDSGWAPESVWTQSLCRGSNLDRPVVQSVVRLSYPVSLICIFIKYSHSDCFTVQKKCPSKLITGFIMLSLPRVSLWTQK